MKKVTAVVKRIPNSGDAFLVNGVPFVALGIEQGGLLAIAERPIGDMPFDEEGGNDWRKSSLRKYLNGEYLENMGKDGLLPFTSDLTSDDGLKDYGTSEDLVFLLSDDLYRKYRKYIPEYKTWWWTITPWSCPSGWLSSSGPSHASVVRFVYASGALNGSYGDYSYGVVPSLLINLASFERKTSVVPTTRRG